MRNEDFQRLLEAVGLLEPPQLAVLADAVHMRQVTGAQVACEWADAPPAAAAAMPVVPIATHERPAPEPTGVPASGTAPCTTLAAIDARFQVDPACPHCQSKKLGRWGFANGLRRYKCKSCKATFNALTGTPLAQLHKRELWGPHAQELIDGGSLRTVAMHLEVHLTTSFRWRHRFLERPKALKAKVLQGVIEADETFFLESFKGKRKLPRPARSRGGKAAKRGLSAEQIPVLIARDRTKATTDEILANRSAGEIAYALTPLLARDSVLVSDGDKSCKAFAAAAKIAHVGLNASAGERVFGIYHIQNVNAYTSRLKAWMARFKGVATAYLDTYLGWFRLDDARGDTLNAIDMLAAARG